MSDWIEQVYQDMRRQKDAEDADAAQKGGPGSGHWGHAGRPGKRGGSLPANVAVSIATGRTARERQAQAAGRGGGDQTTGIQVPKFKTTEGAARWVQDQGIADQVYFDGFDLRVAQGITESLAYHKELMPDLQLISVGNNRQLNKEVREKKEPEIRRVAEEADRQSTTTTQVLGR